MATTQIQCNGTRGAYYAIALTYTENSTSVANNTSNITLTGVIKSTNSYYSYYGYTNTGKLSVDGSAVKTSTSTAEVNTSGVTLVTYTGDVAHSADGSKTITVKFDFSTTYGYLSDTSITVNWELSTIPRASTITASNKTISGTTTANALSYTITSATSFYHTLTYKIGNTTTTIFGTSNPQQVSSTYTGTIPATTILDLIPASKTATVTFTLKTFSDSACKNQIGATQTGTCTVTITIVPTVTLSSITINSTPISGYYVAGKTVAKLTYSKTTPRGASSVTVYFSANKGVTFASSSATSGTTVLTNTLPASTSNYTFTVSVYAIDSRGNQSTTKTLTSSTVYAYAQPKITGKFIRVADSTSTTEDSAGGYVYGTYSGSVGASVNGQNTITSTSCLMNGTGSSLASGFHEVLAQSSGATFVVTVTDKVGTSVSQTFTVSTAVFPLDLYDNGQGTVGVGMGTTAEGGLVQSNMDIRIVKDNQTMVRGYNTGDIYARGNISNDGWIYTPKDMHAEKGFYSYRATYSGGNTASGCVRFATIKITSTNTNGPLMILISPRGMSPTWLTVRFNNSGVDPVLDDCMTRGGNVICGIRKTDTSTWDLYCQTGGSYQNILFEVVASPMLYQGATLTWDNTVSTSWPSDIVYATRGTITPMGTGNVNTANGSLNGQLVIKSASASADGTPNNGIVFEFGNSTNWRGQLFFADNGSEGVWTSGWYSGTHQPWRRLFESNDYRTQNTFVTTGLTYYNSRVTVSGGGYFTSGKMVFVSLSLKINATMGAPDYWLMIQGMPHPRFNTALTCAGISKKGTYGAYINGSGEIYIQTSSTSLSSGDYIAITGFYFVA